MGSSQGHGHHSDSVYDRDYLLCYTLRKIKCGALSLILVLMLDLRFKWPSREMGLKDGGQLVRGQCPSFQAQDHI